MRLSLYACLIRGFVSYRAMRYNMSATFAPRTRMEVKIEERRGPLKLILLERAQVKRYLRARRAKSPAGIK